VSSGPQTAGTNYTLMVSVEGGATMFIANPLSNPHIEWVMRYSSDLNNPKAGRFSVAALIQSYDYLLSDNINMTEATRRLRLMRAARREAIAKATKTP